MKKFLALALLLGSSATFAVSAEAKTADKNPTAAALEASASTNMFPQRRPWRGGARTVTRTRTVRVGRSVYREVIQTRYLPNGRTVTRVISRTRIR